MFVSRLWHLSLLLLAIAACSVAFSEERESADEALTAEFFPMQVGDKWVYAYGDKDVVFKVLKSENVDNRQLFVVQRTIDDVSVNFTLSIRADGVYIHQEGEKQFLPPLRQFAFATKKGDKWEWTGTYGGEKRKENFANLGIVEETVPAGKYTVLAIEQTNGETGDSAIFNLAKGTGVVSLSGKTELIADAKLGKRVAFDWRLKRFERGKD